MASISSISNGEALSSVRTKLNSVITEINLLDPTDWIDYSATSTIVGWSSLTTKQIRYRIIGKTLFLQYRIVGVSNSATTSFTVPYSLVNIDSLSFIISTTNNGQLFIGRHIQPSSNLTASFDYYSAINTISVFTNTGTKAIIGSVSYEIA